jgi:hypothetical protein
MAILVIAEHDNASLKAATLNTVTAAARSAATSTCWSPAPTAARRRRAGRARSPAWPRCCTPTPPTTATRPAENLAALVVANAPGYSHILAPATSNGKNVPARGRLLDVAQISDITKRGRRRHLRPPDLRRQRAGHGASPRCDQGHHRAHHRLRCRGERAAAPRSRRSRRGRPGPVEASVARDRPRATGRNWRGQDHRLRRPRHGQRREVPQGAEPLADKLGAALGASAPRSMPATRPTTTRSARPARSSRRSCTSRSASRARSSTWPA